jgi:hypothetical protein
MATVAKTFSLSTPEGKGIVAVLDSNGIVTFAIDAGSSSSIRGTEMFNRMMQFFGTDAVAIQGVWRRSHFRRQSANIDKVNELTAKGMAIEDAIRQTWTVTRARKLGFTRVRLLGQPIGQPGVFDEIDVLIEK